MSTAETTKVGYWQGVVNLAMVAMHVVKGDTPPNLADTARLLYLLHSGSHRAARRYLNQLGWTGSMRNILEVIGLGLARHGTEAVKEEVKRQASSALAIFNEERLWTGVIID